MLVIGIDPGVTGAFAVVNGELTYIEDLPVSGGLVDPAVLHAQLDILVFESRPHVFIELQSARPGQRGGGKTMRNFGRIEGVIASLGWPIDVITAAKWKRDTRVPADKDGARARASQLMPEGVGYWTLVKHHDRAEAALIAYYGAQLAT